MHTSDTLSQYQERIEGRLQADPAVPTSLQWLAVAAGQGHYLLPLQQTSSVSVSSQPLRVPYTLAWFCGVQIIHGNCMGVVDLGAFLCTLPAPNAAVPMPSSKPAGVVTLNPLVAANWALQVDRLEGVRAPDAFSSTTTLLDAAAPAFFGQRMTDTQGQVWQELDLQALAQSSAFLGVQVA